MYKHAKKATKLAFFKNYECNPQTEILQIIVI